MRRWIALLVLGCWCLQLPVVACAQATMSDESTSSPDAASTPSVQPQAPVQPQIGTLQPKTSEKLDSRLAAVASTASGGAIDDAVTEGNQQGLDMVGSDVRVVVVADAAADPAAIESALLALGGTVERRYDTLTQALVPVGALSTLEAVSGVTWVRPPIPAIATESQP